MFFLDIGTSALVDWKTLYVMDEAFFKLPQCAIRCSLTHIQPFRHKNFKWSEKNIQDFKNLITTTRPIEIDVIHTDHAQEVKVCYIKLVILRHEKRINVNAFLVQELKIAESVGAASTMIIEEFEDDTYGFRAYTNTPSASSAAYIQKIINPPPNEDIQQRVKAKVANCLTPGVSFKLFTMKT